jgi:hypothetical protein
MTDLKLPMAGYGKSYNELVDYQGERGYYWSSSPFETKGFRMYFYSGNLTPANNDLVRASRHSVRCFKNDDKL